MISDGRRRALLFSAVLFILLVLAPSPVPAPIYGVSPNLDSSLRISDGVSVIRILESPDARRLRENPTNLLPTMEWDVPEKDYKVSVVRTLKGDLPENRKLMLSLRFIDTSTLPQGDGQHLPWSCTDDGSTTKVLHLAFLVEKPMFSPYVPEWERAAAFSVNCKRSILPLHPETDLSVADGKPLHDGIRALFEDSASRYQGTEFEKAALWFVDWCDGTAEDR
ncbi:hypothetical protein KQI84_08160 [bacterium]|nr:hypothetical protein [bacterium]